MRFVNKPVGAIEPALDLVQPGQDQWTATGVVLSRKSTGEGNLRLGLFLKSYGVFHVNAPRAELSGKNGLRFGGATEPLVWGKFKLRRNRNGQGFYIEDIDITDDMFELRRRGNILLMAIRWARSIMERIAWGQPSDDLLANLYWCMKFLALSDVPAECAHWRFVYRWLSLWGLAPDLTHCSHCGRILTADRVMIGDGNCNSNKKSNGLGNVPIVWSIYKPPARSGKLDATGLLCPQCSGQREGGSGVTFTVNELEILKNTASLDFKSAAQMLVELVQKTRSMTPPLTELFVRASNIAEKLLVLYST